MSASPERRNPPRDPRLKTADPPGRRRLPEKGSAELQRIALLLASLIAVCGAHAQALSGPPGHRSFVSSFESIDDFAGFFIVPQAYKRTSWHHKSTEVVHSGKFSHKAWIDGANPPSLLWLNNGHRGYPSIQFQKTAGGAFKTPVDVVLWVWVDMPLKPRKGENGQVSLAAVGQTDVTLDSLRRSYAKCWHRTSFHSALLYCQWQSALHNRTSKVR